MGLIKRIIKQEALGVKNKFKKEPERIDIDLPFDFFIGCEIKVGLADFMLMENPEFWTPELAQGGQAQFLRVWDQGHRLADLAWWSETIITDPYGEGAMTFDIGAQLFAREIKTIAIGSSTGQDAETVLEYLLAQTEEDEEGARIALYLGSNVNPAAIELV